MVQGRSSSITRSAAFVALSQESSLFEKLRCIFCQNLRSDHQSYFKMPFIYAIKLFFCINELTLFLHHVLYTACGNSSVGRAQPCQGWGREFESRFPLQNFKSLSRKIGAFFVDFK